MQEKVKAFGREKIRYHVVKRRRVVFPNRAIRCNSPSHGSIHSRQMRPVCSQKPVNASTHPMQSCSNKRVS
jgi:hypothetical protein